MLKFFKKKNKKNGFTLVETLIALFVFSLSVIVVMAVLSTGISSTNYARDKIIATYLAQEGIETFRNLRDNDMLFRPAGDKHAGWLTFVNNELTLCSGADGCYFSSDLSMGYLSLSLNTCTGSCPNLWYSNGTYGYDGEQETVFVRKMLYQKISSDEAQIISEVSWVKQGRSNSIKFSENLTAWIE